MDPLEIHLAQVQNAANSFLKKYHTEGTIPTPIEEIIELKLNINFFLISNLSKDFGVNAFITQDFQSIYADENMFDSRRMRFTLAEEVGHMVLHKEWYLKNGPQKPEDYLTWQQSIDDLRYGYIERQAKTFAGMILMPEPNIKVIWGNFSKKNGLGNPCDIWKLPDTFPTLADKFNVSTDSLLVRLSTLKLVRIPDGFWENVRSNPQTIR
ncbi:MAG TPA: ImmA/IrrE family metallo-endopeptidase [Patescibacteria group bacterium]|nr:ImmA/IrrE family metallo-endopeptidase [Patescibacteria group bacterium]